MSKSTDCTHLDEARDKIDASILKRVTKILNTKTDLEPLGQFLQKIFEYESENGQSDTICQFKFGLLVRFLFSCLIDADRTNTSDFEKPHTSRLRQQQPFTAWKALADRLETHLSKFVGNEPIDVIRREVSDQCRIAADRQRGILSLTVPTGGGKTLASLRFALHHAERHTLDRIIYVIPFTSIIDQNADVVRQILEPKGSRVKPGSIVLEHHSNLTPDKQTWRSKILSENWDAPVIFTTSVQLLESLFGAGTRGARRMHQLARSVIIFDEAQTLPVRCVHIFNNAINFLVEHCGSSVVLCTATQPLLNCVDKQKGAAQFTDADEMIPNPSQLFSSLRRTKIIPKHRPEGWPDNDVAELAEEEIKKTGSCLVIVNTRKAARSLYEVISIEGCKAFHLSTYMCPVHRRAELAEIRERLKHGQTTICVSTQLIEAGVNVDFGGVIRHEAGLDSIAQGAGRCNRNGLRDIGNVYVINPVDDNLDYLPDIFEGRENARRVLWEYEESPGQFDDNILSPAAISLYFRYYFYQRAKEMDYPVSPDKAGRSDTLLNLLAENQMAVAAYEKEHGATPRIDLLQAFRTAGKAFQAIDAPTRGVIVPYGTEGNKLVTDLRSSFEPRKHIALIRRAQQYSVNVFPHVFERLKQSGAIAEIGKNTGIYDLKPTHYSKEFGLSETQINPWEFASA